MHIREEDIEQYALGRSSPDQAKNIESHLAECEICKNKLMEVEDFASQLAELSRPNANSGERDRRREHRVTVEDRAFMHVLDPLSSTREDVRILDLSKTDLKLCVPEFLQPGTTVQVHLKSSFVLGEVRYCSQVGTEFHAGIRITDIFPQPMSDSLAVS